MLPTIVEYLLIFVEKILITEQFIYINTKQFSNNKLIHIKGEIREFQIYFRKISLHQ